MEVILLERIAKLGQIDFEWLYQFAQHRLDLKNNGHKLGLLVIW